MENGPFIDDFPIKTSIYKGFSMAMLNKQMVNIWYSNLSTDYPDVMFPLKQWDIPARHA
jgi:hypothetical protein